MISPLFIITTSFPLCYFGRIKLSDVSICKVQLLTSLVSTSLLRKVGLPIYFIGSVYVPISKKSTRWGIIIVPNVITLPLSFARLSPQSSGSLTYLIPWNLFRRKLPNVIRDKFYRIPLEYLSSSVKFVFVFIIALAEESLP